MKKMLIVIFLGLFLLTGCDNMMNTPTSKVEEFLGRYQKMDKGVLKELKNIVDKDEIMSDDQKKEYKTLLEKQYQNLSYKIKNEIIEKDTATVDVEIEVLDYATAISKSKKSCIDKEDSDDNEEIDIDVENTKDYIECKLKEMKLVNNKTKYDITFTLDKEDGKWEIEKLSENDVKKLHGIY